MTRKKYMELRKKRSKERDEQLKKQREKARAKRLRKRTEPARRRIEEKIEKARLEEERREKARDIIESAKTAAREVEKEAEAMAYVPDTMTEIGKMLADADENFRLADYERAMKFSFEIEELVEKARLEASRKAEERRKRRKGEAKYLYCVIPFSKEKSFGNIGMNDGDVYTIPYRDVAAVVSDSLMKDYEMTENDTRRHEAVLRQVMGEHAVVPAEFGTTIKNEGILKRLLTKAYNPTMDCLNLVDNMVELGVKALLNKDIVFVDPEKRKECVSDILGSLTTRAKQAVAGDLFSDRLILNASFLVNEEDIGAFSDGVTKLGEKYPMLKLLYSGPWAPYNFVYIRIGAGGIEIAKK